MSVKIRMSRAGAKKRPYYNIVIADTRSPRDGRFIEKVGTYNPMLPQGHEDRLRLKNERIEYWLKMGATASDRVHRFLAAAEMVSPRVRREQTKKSQPRAKTLERMKAAEAAAAAAAEKPAESAEAQS